MQDGTRLAAVDLGSNSFRLEIGRIDRGQYYRTEYLKETVRQGNGLDAERNLTSEAMQRGWDCLERFGERLAGFDSSEVHAVATQTLREARNRDEFLARANQALGFPIEVISGREEARLIYQGVAQALRQGNERRIVIDIGGRSTELILGQGFNATEMESYRVGSIAWSMRYFPEGQFTKQAFKMAEVAAKAVFDEALNVYRPDAWDMAYGSAGTVSAVGDVLAAAGFPAGVVSREGLDWLHEKLLSARNADQIKLAGMREDRRPIIGGGLSILRAVFDLFGIEQLHQAVGGLRHGLLVDLIEHDGDLSDVRCKSVQRLAEKFGTELEQGKRVGDVSVDLLEKLRQDSPPSKQVSDDILYRKLRWAAQLHEIGSHISHNDYRKHGAYILDNADVMGFSQTELHKLSLLVLAHRGKLHKLELDFGDTVFIQQLLSLRLAVILCHARRDPDTSELQLSRTSASASKFTLKSPAGWAQSYPQSAHLLREETLVWQKTPWTLEYLEA